MSSVVLLLVSVRCFKISKQLAKGSYIAVYMVCFSYLGTKIGGLKSVVCFTKVRKNLYEDTQLAV